MKVRAGGRLIVNDGMLAGAAVRAGVGLGYMMEHEVADEIADGRLVQVLDDWCRPFPGCHLYYPSRQVTPALRALIDALRWREGEPPIPTAGEGRGHDRTAGTPESSGTVGDRERGGPEERRISRRHHLD